MTSGQLLLDGVELMLVGMGLVLVFLVLLIGCIRGMSIVLQRFAVTEPQTAAVTAVIPTPCDLPDADTLAAIQAAIRQHRGQSA